MKRKAYDSDLTDAQWAILAPFIPPALPGGRPRKHDMREVWDAIFYISRGGCAWRLLPHEFPPWQTAYHYFRAWRLSGLWEEMHAALRERVRVGAGREAQPSASVIDSQTVKTTERGGEHGYDGGKKVSGRKRHILVDTLASGRARGLTSRPPFPSRNFAQNRPRLNPDRPRAVSGATHAPRRQSSRAAGAGGARRRLTLSLTTLSAATAAHASRNFAFKCPMLNPGMVRAVSGVNRAAWAMWRSVAGAGRVLRRVRVVNPNVSLVVVVGGARERSRAAADGFPGDGEAAALFILKIE